MINTHQIISSILKNNINSPVAQNMFQAYQNRNMDQLTDIARNVLREQGRDFDSEFNQMKQKMGIY